MSSLAAALLAAAAIGAAWPATLREAPEWRVREEIRIGAGAGIERLPRISRLLVGRDGIAHVLTHSDEIISFDARGRITGRVRVIGEERRQAVARTEASAAMEAMRERMRLEPPGPDGRQEVRRVSAYGSSRSDTSRAFGWIGDSLWVATRGTGTIALFRQDGRSVREIPYSPSLDGSPANFPLALLPDGSLLRTISSRHASPRARERSVPPPPESFRMPVIPVPPGRWEEDADRGFLVRASPDGRVLQGLEIFAERQLPVVVRNPYGTSASLEVPFQDHPLIAVTPDGAEVVFVERYRPTRAGSTSYSIARFDVATLRRSARHYPYVPRPIARTTIDSLVGSLVDSGSSAVTDRFLYGFPSLAAARSVIEAALEIPSHHPPLVDVLAGADRTVWLREHATSPWTVVGRDGVVLATVALPPGVALVHADAETAWGVTDPEPGAVGSRVLIRYRLLKP